MVSRCYAFVVGLVVVAGGVVVAGESPLAVSPGSETGTLIGDACPTFSWGQVEQAESYELVVYRVNEETEEAKPVLTQRISGSALGWTPPLERCLDRGGQYAWSVRAMDGKADSEWSAPNLFEVSAGPSEEEFKEALQVVRQYLEGDAPESGDMPSLAREPSSSATSATVVRSSAERSTSGPAPLSGIAGDVALQVNGAAVVTTVTLGAGLCEALTYRYIDLGDGTVLDCNTGKMWLKDADCVGFGIWDSDAGAGSVQEKVAALNTGSNFNCADYTPGTYTDWEVPAMTDLCGMWDSSCIGGNCCTASAGIVDTNFSDPTVANAAGDEQWMTEDAFDGVQSNRYWSATESDADDAWSTTLVTGGVFVANKTSFISFVWPVRGGQ